MSLRFPSDAWIKALSDHLNASASYERSAKSWEGDFTFVVEPDDAFSEEIYLFLALHHGKSPGAQTLESLDERDAEYTVRAPYSTWRRVIERKLDPIQGLMTRQLKLKGNMMMIMRYPKAAQEILACIQLIPTEFAG
ncbi:MAG: SCP2 sterol-binding domain-containing protein [Anaerolineae bacterium]